MLGISGTELALILFFGFLIFGPEKLPQIGHTVGRAIRQFRTASETMSTKIKEEVTDPFQEAVSPYMDQLDKETKPLQDDIRAINDNLKETQDALSNPFKDALKFDGSSGSSRTSSKKGGIATAGAAPKAKPVKKTVDAPAKKPSTAPKASADTAAKASASAAPKPSVTDPFAAAFEDDEPDSSTTASKPEKKSMAASLYGLDDDESEPSQAKGGE